MNENIVKTICVAIIGLSVIASFMVYFVNEKRLMAQNIESAISKGIDPLSVRCSYVHSQDLICVAFAASAQSHSVTAQSKK